jgi:hypothetical protein
VNSDITRFRGCSECPEWRAAPQQIGRSVNGSNGPGVSFDMKDELPTFAASAKSKGPREKSERSGYEPAFSVVQTQRTAAASPL